MIRGPLTEKERAFVEELADRRGRFPFPFAKALLQFDDALRFALRQRNENHVSRLNADGQRALAFAHVDHLRQALGKIADPRLRDHREPDAYTELGCVMNIASEALAAPSGLVMDRYERRLLARGMAKAAGMCGACGGRGEIRVGYEEPEMDECPACAPIRAEAERIF